MGTLEQLERTSGDYRIIYECVYAYDHYHRVDDGCGDTRPAGHTREQRVWHVAAPSQKLAEAAWLHHHPVHVNYELVSCTAICTLDKEVRM